MMKNKAKRYVVETYCNWAEPKYTVDIYTAAQIKKLQNEGGIEIEKIYELGKEVKLKMELV